MKDTEPVETHPGIWITCPHCGERLYAKEFNKRFWCFYNGDEGCQTCTQCHGRLWWRFECYSTHPDAATYRATMATHAPGGTPDLSGKAPGTGL